MNQNFNLSNGSTCSPNYGYNHHNSQVNSKKDIGSLTPYQTELDHKFLLTTPQEVSGFLAGKHRVEYAYHNEQKVWRFWNGKYWEKIDDLAFKQLILAEIDALGVEYKNNRFIEETIELLKTKLLKAEWQTSNPKQYINFNNGVLDLKRGKLSLHQPGYGFTSCLEHHYSDWKIDSKNLIECTQKYAPNFYRFVLTVQQNKVEQVELFLAVINSILTYKLSEFQKFIYLIGQPGSGKGTLMRLLEKIVGKTNHESTTLKGLTNKYELAKIIDKQLVLCPDEDKQFGDYGNLKAMTGGDSISYEQKYKDPASAKFDGSLVIGSNSDVFSGDTQGIIRRICLIAFLSSIPTHQRNNQIETLLEKEIDMIINLALSMSDGRVAELINNAGKGSNSEAENYLWQQKCQRDSVAAWIDECISYDPNAEAYVGNNNSATDRLYPNYLRYCQTNNLHPVSVTKFSTEIDKLCSELDWNIERKRDSQGQKIRGLKIKTQLEQNAYLGLQDVDWSVGLKPLPNQDSVDYVDLSNKKGLVEKQNCSSLEKSLPQNYTQSTQPIQGETCKSTPDSTPSLHHVFTSSVRDEINTSELQENTDVVTSIESTRQVDSDSFKVGDKVRIIHSSLPEWRKRWIEPDEIAKIGGLDFMESVERVMYSVVLPSGSQHLLEAHQLEKVDG
ncbi:DNA primase family protein [Stanieria cyanosphaera]|nr:phage/plasmid primase, P4 family [Stanieria cyanosphaera]